jgi:hypothetical protein
MAAAIRAEVNAALFEDHRRMTPLEARRLGGERVISALEM